jgi:LmbE family N-acetylglucosaminyl deacetylase
MWFNGHMRWIIISPHLDDAILSTGGLIYELTRGGQEVEIWTLMCGYVRNENISSFASTLHLQWGFHSVEETIRSRREEDLHAAAILGAHTLHFDFQDCIYRSGKDGSWLYDTNTFISPHPDDEKLIREVTAALAERLGPEDEIVCPLAIGEHVDHVITRQAVEGLKRPLRYYADIPYLLYYPQGLDGVEKVMEAKIRKISWKGLIAWQRAAATYASQIPMEFETTWKMRNMIMRYGRSGVRLWNLL